MQYARKHFAWPHRLTYRAALGIGYSARALFARGGPSSRREAARAALRVLVGVNGPPYGKPPEQAVPVTPTEMTSDGDASTG